MSGRGIGTGTVTGDGGTGEEEGGENEELHCVYVAVEWK